MQKMRSLCLMFWDPFLFFCQTTAWIKPLISGSVIEGLTIALPLLVTYRNLQVFMNFGEKLSEWNTQIHKLQHLKD